MHIGMKIRLTNFCHFVSLVFVPFDRQKDVLQMYTLGIFSMCCEKLSSLTTKC